MRSSRGVGSLGHWRNERTRLLLLAVAALIAGGFMAECAAALNGLISGLPGFIFAARQKGAAKPSPFNLKIPVLVDISGTTYPIAMTFVVSCAQSGTTIKGGLAKTP